MNLLHANDKPGVYPASWYAATAEPMAPFASLQGDVRADVEEVHAWAIMGMNVFLGLRYGVWDDSRPAEEIAAIANALVERGIGRAD